MASASSSRVAPSPPQQVSIVLVHMNRNSPAACRWCEQPCESDAAMPRCCHGARRAARLAAFPRLSHLSDAEFREVQFAVLLRALPKALLAYKFLAPDTPEWKQDGRREAGLLGVQPLVGQSVDESNLRFPPRHTYLWLLSLSLMCFFLSLLIWVVLMDRSPPQPVPSSDPYVMRYPFPSNSSFELVADDARRSADAMHSDCLVILGSAVWATAMLALLALIDLGQSARVSFARCCWMRKPRRRYARLLAAPVHFITLYQRVLPAEAGMPPGELDLDSALREQQALAAFVSLRSAADRVLDLPNQGCSGGFERCYARARNMLFFAMCVGIGTGCGTGLMAFLLAAGVALPSSKATDRHDSFTCLPLRPFVTSHDAPMINQTEALWAHLHPCSTATLWADFELRVENVTTMLPWPCVAPLPTAECYVLWTVSGLTAAICLAGVLALLCLCGFVVRRRLNR